MVPEQRNGTIREGLTVRIWRWAYSYECLFLDSKITKQPNGFPLRNLMRARKVVLHTKIDLCIFKSIKCNNALAIEDSCLRLHYAWITQKLGFAEK